jgi:hypothetical protein
MRTETHNERAALALTTATVVGDEAAAEQHGCSTDSIQRWRARLPSDAELQVAAAHARARVLDRKWVPKLSKALEACIDFVERAATEADPKNPRAIQAVSKAMRTLGEVAAWHEATNDDVRAGPVRGAAAEDCGPVSTGTA